MVVVTVPVYQRLGSEFMPPLDEGSLLYMPSTLPGISVTEAQRLMQVQDRIIKRVPGSSHRARQSGPRGDVHRSRAALDDGDGHRAEAADGVAEGGHLVFVLGARVAERRIPQRLRRTTSPPRN